MKNTLIGAAAIALLAGSAMAERSYSIADMSQIIDLNGNPLRLDGQRSPASSERYTVFTGGATTSNGLALLEPTAPPAFDDLVNYDGVAESINNYVNIAGTGALGQSRTVIESKVVSGGATNLSITVTSTGDMWPSGLALGGVPMVRGAFGIGLNLGSVLGNDPLLWSTPPSVVTAATLEIIDSSGSSGPIVLAPATFFGGAAGWSGIFGVVFSDTTSTTGVCGFNTTQFTLNLTIAKVPAPGAVAVFGLAGAVAARRRRA